MVGTPGLEHSRTRLMSAGVAVDRDQVLEQLGEDPDSPAAAVIERLEAAGLTLIATDRLEALLRRLSEVQSEKPEAGSFSLSREGDA